MLLLVHPPAIVEKSKIVLHSVYPGDRTLEPGMIGPKQSVFCGKVGKAMKNMI